MKKYCIELFTKDGHSLGYIYERGGYTCFGGNKKNRKIYCSLDAAKQEKCHKDFKKRIREIINI